MNNKILEKKFQADTIEEIQKKFPGCIVLKNDAKYLQGIPDFVVHYFNIDVHVGTIFRTAFLEFKRDKKAPKQPNQEAYVEKINNMGGFARFIYPQNKEHVLKELELYFNGALDVPF